MTQFLFILILTIAFLAIAFLGLSLKALFNRKDSLKLCSGGNKEDNCGCLPDEVCKT